MRVVCEFDKLKFVANTEAVEMEVGSVYVMRFGKSIRRREDPRDKA
jgi:hypothetical protein